MPVTHNVHGQLTSVFPCVILEKCEQMTIFSELLLTTFSCQQYALWATNIFAKKQAH